MHAFAVRSAPVHAKPRRSTVPAAAPPTSRMASQIAQAWLLMGCVALIGFPSMRGSDPWIGWLPFWLVFAPLVNLLLLRWRPMTTQSIAAVLRWRRRTRTYRSRAPRASRRLRQGKQSHQGPAARGNPRSAALPLR